MIFQVIKHNFERPLTQNLQVHLDVRKFFFTVRIIDIWNSLPISLINCETIAPFKKHLDCLLKNRGYI